MSVRLFHPMVAPHIQQVARTLQEAGQLDRYVTTVVDRPDSTGQRLLCRAARTIGVDLARELSRRRLTEVPLSSVESHPWGEAFRVAFARATRRDMRWHDGLWDILEKRFDHRVARGLHGRLTGVYGFLYSSLFTFQRARSLGVRIAYDLPSLEVEYVENLLREETTRFPELDTPLRRWVLARTPVRSARRRAEFQLADVVFANSHLTKTSYAAAGLDVSKVRVLHLGAPPCIDRDVAMSRNPQAPLTLLWAGGFSIIKGAHYVLEAWRRGQLGRFASLHVYGSVGIPERVLQPLPEGIHLHGSIPRTELLEKMTQADALLFPSLCDGFGMVATEAWSRGLPVLTTNRAGAADLLRDGENGRLLAAADATAIIEQIHWCVANRVALHAMREAALATAARWQWSDYRRALTRHLHEAGLFGPRE